MIIVYITCKRMIEWNLDVAHNCDLLGHAIIAANDFDMSYCV